MTRPTTSTTHKAIPNEYQSEMDCTSSTVIDPEMESDFTEDRPNFLRDFNLYRYYLSQYPELFTQNVSSPPCTSPYPDVQKNVTSMRPSFQSTPQAERTSSIYLSSLDEDKAVSKLCKLSPHRSKAKLCKRSNTDTVDSGSGRCCFLCRCSSRNQSDSSLWSLSEPDLSQVARDHYDSKSTILADKPNTLSVSDDRYSHLSRVITPPNAFLNNTYANLTSSSDLLDQNNDYSCAKSNSKSVSYSNKLTQTDADYDLNKHGKTGLNDKVQRYHLQSNELPQLSDVSHRWQSAGSGGASIESEHIYHTILEQSIKQTCALSKALAKQKGKGQQQQSNIGNNKLLSRARSLKLEEIKQQQMELLKNGSFRMSPNKVHDTRLNSFPPMVKTSSLAARVVSKESGQPVHSTSVDSASDVPLAPVHRLTNDGIPCSCNRCRESWGLNLTTELLPLDTQIPLQSISMETMENMDSFLQDNVMTFDICTIL